MSQGKQPLKDDYHYPRKKKAKKKLTASASKLKTCLGLLSRCSSQHNVVYVLCVKKQRHTFTHKQTDNRLLLLLAVVVVASASTVIATSGAFIPARFSASSSVSKQNKNKK